ncbi:MAG: hypothetical protein HQL52_05655 [Magnetococcales bacterium]|nr:hypothetical protein [Magnetococcales bacterium]
MKKTARFLVVIGLFFGLLAGTAHADLNDGLVAYYPFNGDATDESGNGYDGTVSGASLTTDRLGVADSAYSFDGRFHKPHPENSSSLFNHHKSFEGV